VQGDGPDLTAHSPPARSREAKGADRGPSRKAAPFAFKASHCGADVQAVTIGEGKFRKRALFGGCAAAVLIAAALAIAGLFRGRETHTAKDAGPTAISTGACLLTESYSGYPDRFIRRKMAFKIHPPLPVGGWRPGGLPFDVLFHSLFHGYLVISYGPDLSTSDRELLRTWVGEHRHARVVAVPTREAGAPFVDLAEWGWEGRCAQMPQRVELSRFAARRGA
jgi:hypothetical protein